MKNATKEYTYAAGRDGKTPLILRRVDGNDPWDIVGTLNDDVDVESMVSDLNRAQRMRPQMEEGQELSRKPAKGVKT